MISSSVWRRSSSPTASTTSCRSRQRLAVAGSGFLCGLFARRLRAGTTRLPLFGMTSCTRTSCTLSTISQGSSSSLAGPGVSRRARSLSPIPRPPKSTISGSGLWSRSRRPVGRTRLFLATSAPSTSVNALRSWCTLSVSVLLIIFKHLPSCVYLAMCTMKDWTTSSGLSLVWPREWVSLLRMFLFTSLSVLTDSPMALPRLMSFVKLFCPCTTGVKLIASSMMISALLKRLCCPTSRISWNEKKAGRNPLRCQVCICRGYPASDRRAG